MKFAPLQKPANGPQVQTKLTIGQPGDKYEQEADRMADRVMAMPQSPVPIQRKCEQCEEVELQMKPFAESITPLVQTQQLEDEEEMIQMQGSGEEEEVLQTKLEGSHSMGSANLSSQLSQSKGGGQPLPSNTSGLMSQAFGTDFSKVRIHTDAPAEKMNRSLNARAFTFGQDIYFNQGAYSPESSAGRHLLAHELTHVVQQDEIEPRLIQCEPCEADISETESVDTIWRRIRTCRYEGNSEIIRILVQELISRMQEEDLFQRGYELIQVLSEQDMTDEAFEILPRIERIWLTRLSSGSPTLPSGIFPLGASNTPRYLISAARNFARSDDHSTAIGFLRSAFLLLQIILVYQSRRLSERLQQTYSEYSRRRGQDIITLTMAYPGLEQVYEEMREVFRVYPVLAQQNYLGGRQTEGDELMEINSTLWFQISEMEGLLPEEDRNQAISLATLRVDRPEGGIGYEIWGANDSREVVNPLEGEPRPDVLSSVPGIWQSMAEILNTLYEQETWITRLYRHPEIVQEFGNEPIDIHNQEQRIRLFRIMHQIFQREGEGSTPLSGLLGFTEEYLQRFTYHLGAYNIRDMGENYINTEFPQDFLGRVVRDCGVYALTTAYDVYQVARVEGINASFEIYTMTDHAALMITEEDENAYFLVNNNEIEGPLYENPAAAVAIAYSETMEREYVAFPSISEPLGSTQDRESVFRRSIWSRYQNVTRWGLLPEPPEPGDTRSVEQRSEASYESFYSAQRIFDEGCASIDRVISRLQNELQESDNPTPILARYIEPLTTAGARIAEIFIRYAAEARSAVGARTGANTRSWMLYQLYATPHRGQLHPLIRLARVLMYYDNNGGQLNQIQEILTNWMCQPRESNPPGQTRIRQEEFCEEMRRYEEARFPPNFDY